MAGLRAFIICAALAFAPGALAQESRASPAFRTAQDGFETAYLRAVHDIREGPPAERLRRIMEAAAPIAERYYGRDWSVVRRETERRLALLDLLDLARYDDRRASFSWADVGSGEVDAELVTALRERPAQLAVLRFYDPEAVGRSIGYMTLAAFLPADEFQNLNVAMTYAPMRVYHARWRAREALVARHGDWMVIIPYELSRYGLITPNLTEIRVYPAS